MTERQEFYGYYFHKIESCKERVQSRLDGGIDCIIRHITGTLLHHYIGVIPFFLYYVIPAKAGIHFTMYRFPIKSGMTSAEYKKNPGKSRELNYILKLLSNITLTCRQLSGRQ